MNVSALFYRIIIDPLLTSLRREISRQIPRNSRVIDIGCGTGSLLVSLAGGCGCLVGVDCDEEMVSFAGKRINRLNTRHLHVFQEDAADLSRFNDREFDVAVLSMAVHQFDGRLVDSILTEAKRIAEEIIIADYTIPKPDTFYGRISYGVEKMAGKEHFRSYLHYSAEGGIPALVDRYSFSVVSSRSTAGGVFSVYRLKSGTIG